MLSIRLIQNQGGYPLNRLFLHFIKRGINLRQQNPFITFFQLLGQFNKLGLQFLAMWTPTSKELHKHKLPLFLSDPPNHLLKILPNQLPHILNLLLFRNLLRLIKRLQFPTLKLLKELTQPLCINPLLLINILHYIFSLRINNKHPG